MGNTEEALEDAINTMIDYFSDHGRKVSFIRDVHRMVQDTEDPPLYDEIEVFIASKGADTIVLGAALRRDGEEVGIVELQTFRRTDKEMSMQVWSTRDGIKGVVQ